MKIDKKVFIGVGVLVIGYLLLKKSKSNIANQNGAVIPKNGSFEIPKNVFLEIPKNKVDLVAPIKKIKVNNVIQNKLSSKGSYDDVIIPKGTVINDMVINGVGGSFLVNSLNEFDSGGAFAEFEEFDILQLVDSSNREKIDKVQFPNSVDRIVQKNGFSVGIRDVVQAKLNKDIVRSYPNKVIIYT